MHLKQKLNHCFFVPSFFRDCFLTLYHLLLRIVQQVRYVLEKSSVQLEHQASAPASSVVTDLTKQQLGDIIYEEFPLFLEAVHTFRTGQICFAMHQSIIRWKWLSNFQGNSPISLPTALTGAPGEITIKETSVCVLSVSISTTPVVGADMKDLPALTEPKFWGSWD